MKRMKRLRAAWLAGAVLSAVVSPLAQSAPPADEPEQGVDAQPAMSLMPKGDAERGRLVFATCRTCHYPEAVMGHNNGPSLHRIFGKVVGSQPGFEYYSEEFKEAQFVWTPQLMYVWLEDPLAMFPGSTMMSRGIADPQQRADLIAYLMKASVRDP